VNSKIVKINTVNTCDVVSIPGYYKIDENYYSINSDGTYNYLGSSITKTDCNDTDDVGSLVNIGGSVKLCASDSETTGSDPILIEFAEGDNHLIKDKSGIYGTDATNIVVSSSSSSITKVTLEESNKYIVKNCVNEIKNGSVGKFIIINSSLKVDHTYNGIKKIIILKYI